MQEVNKLSFSAFKMCVAKFRTEAFLKFLDEDPWSSEASPGISREEISETLRAELSLVPVGLYSDNPADNQLLNMAASRKIHIKRIAWLVKNWKDDPDFAITASFSEDEFSVGDGYHRLYGAHYLRKPFVYINFSLCKVSDVEQSRYFLDWVDKPVHSGVFGEHVISTENMAVEITCESENVINRRFWANDLVSGGAVLRLKSNFLLQNLTTSKIEGVPAVGDEANQEKFISSLLTLYPELRAHSVEVHQAITSQC